MAARARRIAGNPCRRCLWPVALALDANDVAVVQLQAPSASKIDVFYLSTLGNFVQANLPSRRTYAHQGARNRASARPDLCELQLQTGKLRARIQHLNSIETLGIAASEPNFNGLLMGDEQPAEPGAVCLV